MKTLSLSAKSYGVLEKYAIPYETFYWKFMLFLEEMSEEISEVVIKYHDRKGQQGLIYAECLDADGHTMRKSDGELAIMGIALV